MSISICGYEDFMRSIPELIHTVNEQEDLEKFFENNSPTINEFGGIEINRDGMIVQFFLYDEILEAYENDDKEELIEIYKSMVEIEIEHYLDNISV